MDRQYYSLFRTKPLNHQQLRSKILGLFKDCDLQERMNFDQLLYILDERCAHKTNRDVARELFQQAQDKYYKSTLSSVAQAYIENLETSKLCLLRDQAKLEQLKGKRMQLKPRQKAFVYLKIIQVSMFSRFTKDATLEYKISPTDIPPVALSRTCSSVLNHQFVLEMEEGCFDIIFYESGIEIYRWTFPDQPGLPEGEYTRLVESQNVSFEARVKYLPKGKQRSSELLDGQILVVEKEIQTEKKAFQELCFYQPFQEAHKGNQQQEQRGSQTLREKLQDCLPILKRYSVVLFWLSILLTLAQSWASFIWPAEFLDIILSIYLLGLLVNLQRREYNLAFLLTQLGYLLLILKSIWGTVYSPSVVKSSLSQATFASCILLKVLVIFVLCVARGSEDQTRQQCDQWILKLQADKRPAKDLMVDKIENIYESET